MRPSFGEKDGEVFLADAGGPGCLPDDALFDIHGMLLLANPII
jgi:hypothetical protein